MPVVSSHFLGNIAAEPMPTSDEWQETDVVPTDGDSFMYLAWNTSDIFACGQKLVHVVLQVLLFGFVLHFSEHT